MGTPTTRQRNSEKKGRFVHIGVARSLGLALLLSSSLYSNIAFGQECAIDEEAAPEVKARARELHSEYLAAVDANDWKKAWVAAQQAYALNPCWKIALNLGIAAVKTRRYVQGARLLSEALLTCRHDCPESVRLAGEDHLDEATNHVARIRIQTDIESAVVLVDGKRLSEREANGFFVQPGEHFIVVRGANESSESTVTVGNGELATVELNRDASGATEPSPQTSTEPNQETHNNRAKHAVLYTGLGLTTVAAGFTVGFLATAGARQNDVDALRSEIVADSDSCRGSSNPACAELEALAARRDVATTRAQVSSIATGVFGIATVGVLLFWPNRDSSSVTLNVGPQTISVSGIF